ncbi:MAG: 4Fe-4S dicluster domain-containing protein [Dehalococcoidia bacterium]
MFDETRCDLCGDCLERCSYVEYEHDRAVAEIQALIDGKEAPILSRCITCYACNEYCPQEA